MSWQIRLLLFCLVVFAGRNDCNQKRRLHLETRSKLSTPNEGQERWLELSPKNIASFISSSSKTDEGELSKIIPGERKSGVATNSARKTLHKEAIILGNPMPSIENGKKKVDHLLEFAHQVKESPEDEDSPPVTVSLLPNSNDDERFQVKEGAELKQRGQSPKYVLRQIFNDTFSKIISSRNPDPYAKPGIVRNLPEKRFDDLFLRHKSQYDGLDVYKQTQSDYEQFEKLDSSPIATSNVVNKRGKDSENAMLEKKISALKKELSKNKSSDKQEADKNVETSKEKSGSDNDWVSKAISKLNNGDKIKENNDTNMKKKLFQTLKTQLLFDKNFQGSENEEVDKLSMENENEKSSEEEYQKDDKAKDAPKVTEKFSLPQTPKKPQNRKKLQNTAKEELDDNNFQNEGDFKNSNGDKQQMDDFEKLNDLPISSKKPSEDQLPPPTDVKPKEPKKPSPKPDDVERIPPPVEDLLKPENPFEDRYLKEGANGVKPLPIVPSKSRLLFSYDDGTETGPMSWQRLNPSWTCEGRKQSPINIKTSSVFQEQMTKNVVIKQHPPHLPLTGVFKNNGHSPTFTLTGPTSVRLLGGTLLNAYYLKQIHFHFGCSEETGSEHFINGVQYPLEMHLVFWDNSTYRTFSEAAKGDRGIAAVALLFQSEDATQHVPEDLTQLFKISELLPHIHNEGSSVLVEEEFGFLLDTLVPYMKDFKKSERVFIYDGSLSTPGCYESVVWIVYDQQPFVSEKQLQAFRELRSTKVNQEGTMCNNYRPIQKSFGRKIFSNII